MLNFFPESLLAIPFVLVVDVTCPLMCIFFVVLYFVSFSLFLSLFSFLLFIVWSGRGSCHPSPTPQQPPFARPNRRALRRSLYLRVQTQAPVVKEHSAASCIQDGFGKDTCRSSETVMDTRPEVRLMCVVWAEDACASMRIPGIF